MRSTRRIDRRSASPRRVAAVAAALLALTAVSGCGSTRFTPGAAATVNGEAISQDRVNSIVSAACAYTVANAEASGQPPAPVSLANLRASITQAVVQFALTDRAAQERDITVTDAVIAEATAANPVPDELDEKDKAALEGFFEEFGRSNAQLRIIGANLADPSVTTLDEVTEDRTQQASKYLESYTRKQDVTINPAYGEWTGDTVTGGSGSLSDPVSRVAKASQTAAESPGADTAELPASQVC